MLATLIEDDVMRRWGHVDSDVTAVRRRGAGGDVRLTSRDIEQLMDAHNSRRRRVDATNMQLVVGVQLSPSLLNRAMSIC